MSRWVNIRAMFAKDPRSMCNRERQRPPSTRILKASIIKPVFQDLRPLNGLAKFEKYPGKITDMGVFLCPAPRPDNENTPGPFSPRETSKDYQFYPLLNLHHMFRYTHPRHLWPANLIEHCDGQYIWPYADWFSRPLREMPQALAVIA